MRAVRIILIILLNFLLYGLIVFVGFQLCQHGYTFAYEVGGDVAKELPPGHAELFPIDNDDTAMEVADNLVVRGIIEKKMVFYARLMLEGGTDVLRPGNYMLNSSMSNEEIISIICKTKTRTVRAADQEER